ncbi:MAG: DUF177 domain-containing protein [Acidobacteriota bacterium]|jgi:uncharacterized protein|nr:DUF177 domain-containing protein [Acidobacteriota bacterium]
MLIETAKIGPAGMSLADIVEMGDASLIDEDGSYLDDIHYSVHLARDGERIRARGSVRTTVSLTCVRCLEEFEQKVNSSFDIILFPVQLVDGGSISLSENDLETIFFRGNHIDLARIMSEQVNICIPDNPVCRPDCRGICPNCGANLNFESCQCEQSNASSDHWPNKIKR